jgi:hypothetical protein
MYPHKSGPRRKAYDSWHAKFDRGSVAQSRVEPASDSRNTDLSAPFRSPGAHAAAGIFPSCTSTCYAPKCTAFPSLADVLIASKTSIVSRTTDPDVSGSRSSSIESANSMSCRAKFERG